MCAGRTERGERMDAPQAAPSAPSVGTGRAARTGGALRVPSRVLPWLVPAVYLAGSAGYLVLNARLGVPGLDLAEGLPLLLGFGMFAATGALLIAKRPRNTVGWILSAAAVLLAVAPAGDAYAAWKLTTGGRPDPLVYLGAWLQSWYWYPLLGFIFVFLPLLFPDGRLPSRRWRPIAALACAGVGVTSVLGML